MLNEMFFKNLKYIRENNNLTQAQMAEKLEMTRQTYARWEKYGRKGIDYSKFSKVLLEFGYSQENLMEINLETGSKVVPKKAEVLNPYGNSVRMHLNYTLRKLKSVKERLTI